MILNKTENIERLRAELNHAVKMEYNKNYILEISHVLDKYIAEYLYGKYSNNNMGNKAANNITIQD
jgi:hypothetical protein